MIRYRTARLTLRRWSEADLTSFARLNADTSVMEFMPRVLERSESDALVVQFEAHFAAHGFGPWAIELSESASLLGVVGLSRPTFTAGFTPCVELSYRLSRESWGHGYATEAAREVCRIGFDDFGLSEIVAFTVPFNLRSRRVMERLGMRHDHGADFDHPRLPEGHPLRRHVLYRLPRERWLATP